MLLTVSETSVSFYKTAWHNTPEGSHLHTCFHENLKSHNIHVVYFIITADVRRIGHSPGVAVVPSMVGDTITGDSWEVLKGPKWNSLLPVKLCQLWDLCSCLEGSRHWWQSLLMAKYMLQVKVCLNFIEHMSLLMYSPCLAVHFSSKLLSC